MELSITPAEHEDIELLVREVEYPAHRDGPLHRLMFAPSDESNGQHAKDEIKWLAEGLHEAVKRGNEVLYKACIANGSPVGLVGWTTGAYLPLEIVEKGHNRDTWLPPSLNIFAWRKVSRLLGEERRRVLQSFDCDRICRITFMAVKPECQRKGVGSALLQAFSQYVEEKRLDSYVLSSPAGVPLYSKFGFTSVGVVETKEGTFTSMLKSLESSSVIK